MNPCRWRIGTDRTVVMKKVPHPRFFSVEHCRVSPLRARQWRVWLCCVVACVVTSVTACAATGGSDPEQSGTSLSESGTSQPDPSAADPAEADGSQPEDKHIVSPVFVPYVGIETWPRQARLEAALDKVVVPSVFRRHYDQSVLEVVGAAANSVARVQASVTPLHGRRQGDELAYYRPLRAVLSDRLWADLDDHVADGVAGESTVVGALVPQTDRDGVWATIDGVSYRSTGVLEVRFWGIPRFAMSGDRPQITFPLDVTAHAEEGKIGYSSEFTATMEWTGGRWVLVDWAVARTSELTVLS